MHMRSKGREEGVEDKDHVFAAAKIGCHGVNKQQYWFNRNRISADEEMNEVCFKRGKRDVTVLKLSSMLRSNLRGNELL